MPGAVRIARIITRLNIGGPAIQATTLSAQLNGQDFETLLIYGQADPIEGDIRSVLATGAFQSAQVTSLRRSLNPLRDVAAFSGVYRLLCRFQPEIVHTHTAKAGTIGRLAAFLYNATRGRRKPARIVHTYHGHVFERYFPPLVSTGFVAIERLLARRTDAIVTISPRIQDDILNRFHIGQPGRSHVVPLGFELERYAAVDAGRRASARQDLTLPAGTHIITTVGRLTGIKQQALFLEMAGRLRGMGWNAIFLIVGDGALRESLERQCRDLGLTDCVRFLGWRGDLPLIYAATDVFVLTSANEGTPVALIEAMASGVASVSTDVGGVRDVISDPECGMLVPAGDVVALTAAVSSLLGDADARIAMGAAARGRVLPRFGMGRLVRDLSDLYRTIA